MSYYINVDHSRFENTARSIDDYISSMKRKMTAAQDEVRNLALNWQGKDYSQFQSQWGKVTESDSTYMQMVKALESYSKFLRYAASQYKESQSKAVNRANGLPRY